MADIHVARHVDIDGIRQSGDAAANDHYSETVERARNLVRTLETVTQAIYDDSSTLLLAAQTLHDGEKGSHRPDQLEAYDLLHSLSSSLGSNLGLIKDVFDGLLSVGQQQAELSQGDYNGFIDWRMSRLSVINDHFDDPSHKSTKDSYHSENEDVVDMELAFNRPGMRSQKSTAESSYDSYRTLANSNDTVLTRDSEVSLDNTLVTQSPTEMRDGYVDNDMGLYEDEGM